MEKKYFTLALVIILGVLVGLFIVGQQAKDPLLQSILKTQHQILATQQNISGMLKEEAKQDALEVPSGLGNKIAALEAKVNALETQVKGYAQIFGKIQGAMGQQGQRQQPQKPPTPPDANKVYDIPVAHSYVIGDKKAPVTVTEFLDIQCPYCGRFHFPMKEAVQAMGSKVNYIVKNFPLSFHPMARSAAKAALAAGEQGKYAEMVDILLKNQRELSDQKYEELAKELKLNVKKFKKDYTSKDAQWEEYIKADMALGMKINVRGTPTFFINGKKMQSRDVEGIKKELEAALKEAQKK